MKKYTWILFDADETLFHFDAFSGLKLMFSHYGVAFTQQDYEEYEIINRPLWVDYQNGSITAEQLQCQRFNLWANKLQCAPQDLNSAFMAAMAEICTPLEGAVSLLNVLKEQAKLGIITNGFTQLQQVRLQRTGLREHFELIVISEEVGFAKPHQGIFDHTLAIMGHPVREQVLMVGDNPDSDILGGINAGLHTCWLNRHNKPVPEGIKPHYQVSSLAELGYLLVGKRYAQVEELSS
ncbi:pyrimidine 5'-nucleotidase [Legionella maioricensis]|uniref:Pyrimidine 5'-nucleotidase n=1 Tax=Legionella maioricensis TaxID=2896528 RepID=A0A9X2D0D4_9GAMM|nr:pyrimidine 5'-nucleotidase [Legionella maioricensis]MCL9687956.1 pyrimidine 5'-nucleotidase [Legionella maioricensis]